jgi:hypothetical protein
VHARYVQATEAMQVIPAAAVPELPAHDDLAEKVTAVPKREERVLKTGLISAPRSIVDTNRSLSRWGKRRTENRAKKRPHSSRDLGASRSRTRVLGFSWGPSETCTKVSLDVIGEVER